MAIRSLQLRLTLQLIIGVTVVLAVFGGIGHRQMASALDAEFAQMQAATVARLANSAAAPMWEVNAQAVSNILIAEMSRSEIAAIQVQDLDGKVFVGRGRDAEGKIVSIAAPVSPNWIAVDAPVLHQADNAQGSEKIGRVIMYFTRDHLERKIQNNVQRLTTQILTIDAMLIVLLLVTLRMVFKPLAQLRDALMVLAGRVKSGQETVDELPVSPDREIGDVERGFNLMLRKIREESCRHETLLAGKARAGELSRRLQEAADHAAFGEKLLGYLAPWLGAEVAALFIRDEDGESFRCVAGYGVAPARCTVIHAGEGIGGEVVAGRKPITLNNVPEDFLRIESASLSITPHTVAVVPVTGSDKNAGVIAVLEFGYLQESPFQDEILAEALPVIAFSLELLTGELATLKDLTARAVIEERQHLILASMQEGLFGQDSDGCVTFINAAALRMLGFDEADLLGQHMHALTHHHFADGQEFLREACPIFLTSQDGTPRTVKQDVFWRKDGTALSVEYTTAPLWREGRILGAVANFRTITHPMEDALPDAGYSVSPRATV